HFTVYFFGELDSQEINGLSSIMEDPELHVDKIQANFKGYSQFPEKGNPRVIHLELDQGKEPVIEVNRKFLEKLHKQGLDRPEGNKKFIPHLTLCRNREEKIKPGFIDSLSIPNGPFVLDRLVLFKSVLKPGGAEYSPLKTIEFR
ncbi:MAG: RNA 2',3'-cyclic phosphodiesterase, partial [Spirochaetales bacterium]|nr:RNA 2',3'-cyclic phosphodiesterase [Spirochaetales bacterium]